MKLFLNENQEISDAYKNSLIAQKIAMRKWRNDFIKLWIEVRPLIVIEGKEYLGGYFKMDRCDGEQSSKMAELLGMSEENIAECVSFMDHDGPQDIDLRFSKPFDTTEESLGKWLVMVYEAIESYKLSTGNSSFVYETQYSYENPLVDVSAYNYSFIENNSLSWYQEESVTPSMKPAADAWVWAITLVSDLFDSRTSTVAKNKSILIDDDYTGLTLSTVSYLETTIDISDTSFLTLEYARQLLHLNLYNGDNINSYYDEINSSYDIGDPSATYSIAYYIFKAVSNIILDTSVAMIFYNGLGYVAYDCIKHLSGKDFAYFISQSLNFYARSGNGGGFWGTFVGKFIHGFLASLGQLAGLIDNIPILNFYFYQFYYALKVIDTSEGDLDNIEIAYRKARTEVLLFYLGGGFSDVGVEQAAIEQSWIDQGLLMESESYKSAMLGWSELGDAVSTGADIYFEITTPKFTPQNQETTEEPPKEGMEIVQGADDFDAFYAQMVYDPSELEWEDYFEDPTILV